MIKGVRKAVCEFNSWRGPARIYYDSSGGRVWTNIYTAPGWWTNYCDPDIVEICSKATYSMYGRDNSITPAFLQRICRN